MADETTSSVTVFFDLPWEDIVFSHIFKYLEISQIFSCRRVSKTFKKMCQCYFDSCRSLNCSEKASSKTKRNSLMPPEAFKTIVQNNNSLQHLILKDCKDTVNQDSLIKILKRSPRLLTLDISGILNSTNLVLFVVGEHCRSLKKISLSGCRWVDTDGIVNLSMCCPELEYIDLSGCWEITDYCVTSLASFSSHLQHIALNGCYGITNNGLRSISRSCQCLKHLGVTSCWRITDVAIRAIGEYCAALESLDVKDCRDVTEASLARLRVRGIDIDVAKPPAGAMAYMGNVRIGRLSGNLYPNFPVINLNI